MAVHLWS